VFGRQRHHSCQHPASTNVAVMMRSGKNVHLMASKP
jgi:hypothetical protein